MKLYPSYESTNDRFWNKDIPSNWGMKRIGSVFTQRNEKVSDTDYEPLSVTKKGIFLQWENVSKSDSHDNRKLVLKNDFVINSRSDRRGSSGLSKYDGSVSLINTVLTPSNEVEPKYSEYIFKSYEFINEFYKNGRGIVDDLWSTKYSLMKNIYICIPPHPEQKQIVSFLDTKTQKIDELIEKTEQKIELLKEKRTSLINHCVTKGLNPNVEIKDSGVEWIGEIPNHWISSKLKYHGKFFSGYSFDSGDFDDEGEVRVIKISNIQNNGISWDDLSFLPKEYYDKYEGFRVVKGDLVFVLTRPIISSGIKVCFYDEDYLTLLNQRNSVFRSDEQTLEKRFLFYLVRSFYFVEEFKQQLKETNQPNISTEQISNIKVNLPPSSEQTQIVEYLDEHTQKIDNTIEKETQRIELLKEFRQSLISEVVTGKVDLRDYNG